MRLFIAVLFPPDAVSRIAAIRDSVHDLSVAGSFTPAENLHLTLEFLGECGQQELPLITEAMEAVSAEPFSISMGRIGSFQRPDGDIWWLGADESSALISLQRNLRRELAVRGLRVEKRKYRPHITLGRRVVTNARTGRTEPVIARVSSFSLMLSERGEGRMVYTPLYTRELE